MGKKEREHTSLKTLLVI